MDSLSRAARGQIGFEYIVFTAFLLGIAALLFAYSFVSYSTTVQNTQSQAVVDSVANAIDFVYAKGPGNSVLIDVKIPSGWSQFRVDQNSVRATYTPPVGGATTLFAFTKTKINPAFLYFQPGIYTLNITMTDTNASVVNT
jgi:hypothetical protein